MRGYGHRVSWPGQRHVAWRADRQAPDNAKAVHARLAGKKQLACIDKGTQTDFYDVPEFVNIAADCAAAWFEETL
jgi:hypothetical protein